MGNSISGFNPDTLKRVLEGILSKKYGCKIEVVLRKDAHDRLNEVYEDMDHEVGNEREGDSIEKV